MSDEIYCAVEGCDRLAEVELGTDRKLWLCGDDYAEFVGHLRKKIAELETQLGEAQEYFGNDKMAKDYMDKCAECLQLRAEKERLREALHDAESALKSLPEDILGLANNGMPPPEYRQWPIMVELLDKITQAQKGGDGDRPGKP